MLDEQQARIDQIFANVDQKLEVIISQYRILLISAPTNDMMYERLFAFCDELEALRKKIRDNNIALANRIEYIGNLSKYIKDFVKDISDYKKQFEAKTISHEVISFIGAIESGLHFIQPDSTQIEDQILENSQEQTENYFMQQQKTLKKMIAEHPELL